MKMSAEEKYIRKLARKYWDEGELPPQIYITKVAEYIMTHKDEFRGATPQ